MREKKRLQECDIYGIFGAFWVVARERLELSNRVSSTAYYLRLQISWTIYGH